MANELIIENINKQYVVKGKSIPVLENINLAISQGEFVVIVGHSGCGKSTLLKIIAGLEVADEGRVVKDNAVIDGPGLDRGMIFQEHRLIPWLTIEKNVALAIENASKQEKEKKTTAYLDMVKLLEFRKAYPAQLSGGMSQRAAIARALLPQPEILLLDEPLGALDALTKIELQQEIKQIWQQEKTTMIMVTHDIEEAVFLADRIVVMSARPGKIKEIIQVNLGAERDRGSGDFVRIKKRVYQHFFADSTREMEYVI